MNVFIIGGTGYLGSVVVEHLLQAGHTVEVLARSEDSADRLRTLGARPMAGSISDTDVLEAAAARADAVVYAASDYAATAESMQVELDAVAAMVAGAASSSAAKPVIYTSTGLVYGFDPADVSEDAERIVLATDAVSGIVIRAGLIFGRGGTGLVTGLIAGAVANGASTYIGDGENTWTPVHVDDLADLSLRALEHPVPGVFNAAGTIPFAFKDLAAAIGELTGTPAVSVPVDIAEQRMGPGVRTMTIASRLPIEKAHSAYGWRPSTRSLLDDIRSGSYSVPA